MTHQKPVRLALVCGVLALLPIRQRVLFAHEMRVVGPFHLMIGWGDEPALSGLKNSVEVDISEAGVPVSDVGGALAVEVMFGEKQTRLPLSPVRDRPGKVRAWLVPTRPGTYTFHIIGTVKGQPVDTTSTCSHDVRVREDVSEQFP